MLNQFEIAIHVKHVGIVPYSAYSNREVGVRSIVAVKENQPEPTRDTERLQARQVVGGPHAEVRQDSSDGRTTDKSKPDQTL